VAALQALLDEQRNAQVNAVLLTALLKVKDTFAPSGTLSAPKPALPGEDAAHLATIGSAPPTLGSSSSDDSADCAFIPAGDDESSTSACLACAGLDVVVLVRNNGLPCPVSAFVGRVRCPAADGQTCAPLHPCAADSLPPPPMSLHVHCWRTLSLCGRDVGQWVQCHVCGGQF
jgi:hypothetical protein